MTYKIGATYPPSEFTPAPYPAQYEPWTRVVGQNGEGKPVAMGFPTLEWRWSWLLYADVLTLLNLCGTSPSAEVFVTTRLDDGTFAEFSAVLWRPTSSPLQGGRRGNVVARFTQLVPVPGFSSGEVGNVADDKVVITFNEDVSASNYANGVTIKVNGSAATISSATRQADHSVVHFVLSAVVTTGQTVTFEYAKASGDYTSETSGATMQSIAAQSVTNNT